MALAAFLTAVTLLSVSSVLAAQPPLPLYMAADLPEAGLEEPDASQEDASQEDLLEGGLLEEEPRQDGPPAAPWKPVSAAGERRLAIAGSDRVLLSMVPVQVAAGGRAFVYGELPASLMGRKLGAEVLLYEEGAWKRRHVFSPGEGKLGRLSSTLVAPEREPGPVVAALYAQLATNGARTISSLPVSIPRSSELRFGYSVDSEDWKGLAPVDITVRARVFEDGRPGLQTVKLFSATLDPGQLEPAWFDIDVDVSSLGGRQVSIEFESRSVAGGSKVVPAVVWSSPVVVARKSRDRRPSLVIVGLDSFRYTSMGCCGSRRDTTPFMDEWFGGNGAIFDNASTPSVTPQSAWMSLFTGLYPSVHGVLDNNEELSPQVDTLAALLSRGGYRTVAFTEGGAAGTSSPLAAGFDSFVADEGYDLADTEGRLAGTLEAAGKWVNAHPDEPFFMFVHSYRLHAPHLPPQGYGSMFKDDKLFADSRVDEGSLVRYERELRYVDDQLGAFVDSVVRKLGGNVVVVVTADHGQEFLEHGARGAGSHLYEESLKVPLMMSGPGIKKSTRYDASLSLVDLAPTLVELLGIDAPPGLQGVSLASSLGSGLPFSLSPRFSEARGRLRVDESGKGLRWKSPAYAVKQGRYKLIMQPASGGGQDLEAYDLAIDPAERNNLLAGGGQAPAWAATLTEALLGYPVACQRVARGAGPSARRGYAGMLKSRALGEATIRKR